MKAAIIAPASRLFRLGFIAVTLTAIWFCTAPKARAGLTLEMNVVRYHQYGYYFFPNLTTNTTAPNVTFGDYFVTSFGYPTNRQSALYHFDTTGFNQVGGDGYGSGDFDGIVRPS